MPRLRSQTTSEKTTETTTGNKMKKKIEEQSQWVMVGPQELIQKQENQENEEEGVFCTLPHPQNGVSNLFLFKGRKVFQLMRCEEKFRSWFINETVQKDGSIHFITPVGPLFLVLPYMVKQGMEGKFVPLDNILVDPEYPLGMQLLEKCLDKRSLMNLCECKGTDDFVAYKASEERILQWIELKVKNLSSHLKSSSLPVDASGARSKTFIRVVEKTEEDCMKYAWIMISDYLSPTFSKKIKERLNISDLLVKASTPVVEKKQKLSDKAATTGVVEDYRTEVKEPAKKKPKLTAQQAKLQKIDKKGMKTMSSFFAAKPKK